MEYLLCIHDAVGSKGPNHQGQTMLPLELKMVLREARARLMPDLLLPTLTALLPYHIQSPGEPALHLALAPMLLAAVVMTFIGEWLAGRKDAWLEDGLPFLTYYAAYWTTGILVGFLCYLYFR